MEVVLLIASIVLFMLPLNLITIIANPVVLIISEMLRKQNNTKVLSITSILAAVGVVRILLVYVIFPIFM